MHILKKLGRFFTASLLKISLLLFATTFALNGIIGSPEPVLDSMDKSGVYETLVPGFLETASQEEGESGREELPVDDPKIQEIINSSFSPDYLKSSANKVVRGFHSWLNGDTETPNFTIDVASARQSLIQGLATHAEKRLLSLKPCTAAQMRELAGEEIDPFTVPCRPPVVVSQEKKKIIKELENSEFLKDPELTSASLTKDNPDQFTEELKGVPDGYQLLKSLPVITLPIALVSAAALVMLHDDRRRGLRQVALILVITGVLLLLSTILFQVIYDRVANPANIEVDNASLKNSLVDLFGRLYSRFNRTLMLVSAIYALVGGGTLGFLWQTGKKAKTSPEEVDKPGAESKDGSTDKKSGEQTDKS